MYVRFSTKLYRQDVGIAGIPMGTNCAPLVADLVLFCYKRDFMLSLSGDKFTHQGAVTQNHLKPKVTERQFSGYRKIKNIYVKTMLLCKVIGGMAIILNSYDRKRYKVVRI